MQSLTKTVYSITQKSRFCKSSVAHHLQLPQKSLPPYGLEKSWEKFLFLLKGLIHLPEYPLMPGCLACSIALISSKVFFLGEKKLLKKWLQCYNLLHCFCRKESKKLKQLIISFSIPKILLRSLQLLLEKIAEKNILFGLILM